MKGGNDPCMSFYLQCPAPKVLIMLDTALALLSKSTLDHPRDSVSPLSRLILDLDTGLGKLRTFGANHAHQAQQSARSLSNSR